MPEEEYPEHQKLKAVKEKSQAIGEFLDWLLGVKGFRIAKWMDNNPDTEPDEDEEREQVLVQQSLNTQQILAEFYGIDLDKLEQEKRAMLDKFRELNEKRK